MSDDAIHPVELSKHQETQSLIVCWSDGVQQSIKFRALRDKCPCAHCIDKRIRSDETNSESPTEKKTMQLNVLSPAQLLPLDIAKMEPVGNYAYNIVFSDGHSSGIYPFAFLRTLGNATDSTEGV